MRRNLLKILGNLEVAQHTDVRLLILDLHHQQTPCTTYHNVIHINETLVSLGTQLLNERNRTRTEVSHLDFRIHQFAAQTLEYALLRHDLLPILKVVRSANLEVLSCQSDPTVLSVHRIVTLHLIPYDRSY